MRAQALHSSRPFGRKFLRPKGESAATQIKFTLRHLPDLQQMILADPLESGSETSRPADDD